MHARSSVPSCRSVRPALLPPCNLLPTGRTYDSSQVPNPTTCSLPLHPAPAPCPCAQVLGPTGGLILGAPTAVVAWPLGAVTYILSRHAGRSFFRVPQRVYLSTASTVPI